ncbi:MAG: nucleotidyltransferase family protein [Spirochaetes bacterium]|jgi:hypothetical protein|nr:nucleotidyltransferase family protein [Spirochaetota bacterium]
MKKLNEIEAKISGIRDKLKTDYKVKTIGIFGSYARGENGPESDVDILVEFLEPVGFFKFMELEEYLEAALEIKVDLVSKNALKPFIGRSILSEVVYI